MKQLLSQIAISLKEDNSSANRKKWANHIIENNLEIFHLMPLLDKEKTIAMRFTWVLGDICEIKPEIVFPALNYLFIIRDKINFRNFDRSLAKFFWLAGIPNEIKGEVVNELFTWLLDKNVSVSTKNYALFALYNVTKEHNEFKNELKSVIENQLNKNTSSFDKRALQILQKLN